MARGKKIQEDPAASLTEAICQGIRGEIRDLIREEMDRHATTVLEGKFYRDVAIEMREGLFDMYETLSQFKKAFQEIHSSGEKANIAFQEVSDQLDAVVRSTEQATNRIMDLAEEMQRRVVDLRAFAGTMPEDGGKENFLTICDQTEGDILGVITACSFQDITGQRIKKAVHALQAVEKILLRLMVTAGIKMKGRELGKEEVVIQEETERAMEMLAGPQEGSSQADVDSILAELGF